MAKVRWSQEAETWLKDIYNYIAIDNPGAAASVVDGIYQKAQASRSSPTSATYTASKRKERYVFFCTVITASPT
jgi:plasmid stabilization system protein ParE